jgi:hypothetical protein
MMTLLGVNLVASYDFGFAPIKVISLVLALSSYSHRLLWYKLPFGGL